MAAYVSQQSSILLCMRTKLATIRHDVARNVGQSYKMHMLTGPVQTCRVRKAAAILVIEKGITSEHGRQDAYLAEVKH